MKNLAFICYSHSEYSDVWDMFFGQLKKYIPKAKIYFFINKLTKDVGENIKVIEYDDTIDYSNKVLECLEQIEEPLCVYHQEDMVLYDTPDFNKLSELCNFISEYKIDYIKLLKGGHLIDIKLDNMPIENLYWIPHNTNGISLSYTNQPTIWKVNKLKEVFKNTPNTHIRDFEVKASNYVNKSDLVGLYWFANEGKRGMHHWDSNIYPCGGMISKGKWDSSYNKELEILYKKYNINKELRGQI